MGCNSIASTVDFMEGSFMTDVRTLGPLGETAFRRRGIRVETAVLCSASTDEMMIWLRARLRYDAGAGKLYFLPIPATTWQQRGWNKRFAGREAGTISQGYRNIVLEKQRFLAHHIVWFFEHGEFPDGDLDHRNGVRSDNRFGNLRKATKTENAQNRKVMKDTQSGIKGAWFHKGNQKWESTICVHKRRIFLGNFPTAQAAGEAYAAAEKTYFGEFARAA